LKTHPQELAGVQNLQYFFLLLILMKTNHILAPLIISLFLLLPFVNKSSFPQEKKLSPAKGGHVSFHGTTSALRTMKIPEPIPVSEDSTGGEVKNQHKFPPYPVPEKNFDSDPVLQKQNGTATSAAIIHNFEGTGNLQYKLPPDPVGAVGADHYIQMVNMSFTVFDKSGNELYGPAPLLTLWQEIAEPWAQVSSGDPIVLYDALADRWLISELALPNHPMGPYYVKVAVSQTPDPLGAWFLYRIEFEHFCDYPKVSVWPDGYYFTTNNLEWTGSQWSFHGVGVTVLERDSVLVGSPDARTVFFDFHPNTQPWSMLSANPDGPPPQEGTPAYLAYIRDGVEVDRIFLYMATVDWENINNSTLLWMDNLLPESFSGDLPNGITQPEEAPYLATQANKMMFRLQYRYFEDYEVLVANHTVNRGDDISAIRWYELRNYGDDWEIYQQGTYSVDDNNRWMGSAAMDGYGNIAVGYSVSGEEVYPSIRFAGRTADAPMGFLNIEEQTVMEGSGVQLNPNHRWGDYSCLSVDPTDQTTFYYTQQYYETSSDRGWQTRVAAFHINAYLTLSIEAAIDTVCAGDSLQLNANPAGGSGNYTFSWSSFPPGFSSQEQNPVVAPQSNITYFCTVNDRVNTTTASRQIAVNPQAYAHAGEDVTICDDQFFYNETAVAENFTTLFWSSAGDGTFDDNSILNATYFPGASDINSGNVILSLSALPLAGCDETQDDLELTIENCTRLKPEPITKSMTTFPNPANEKVYCLTHVNEPIHATLSLFSLSSDLALKNDLDLLPNEQNLLFDASSLQRGTYLLLIVSEKENHVEKILIR
jgi:hypothetical protein